MTVLDMEKLFNPRSAVLFCISEDQFSQSCRPLSYMKSWGYQGKVFCVKKNWDLKWEGFEKVQDLSQPPDVAMIDLEPGDTLKALEMSASMGIKFALILSSFRGPDQSGYLESLSRVKELGMRVLGPESYGLANFSGKIPLGWSSALDRVPGSGGSVALIAQGGPFGFSAYAAAAESGVPFRYVATTGISSDLDVTDLGHWILQDKELKLMIFYLQELTKGRAFLKIVEEARSSGISVAVMRGGAMVNCGSCSVADNGVWSALSKQFGFVLLDGFDEMTDLAALMAVFKRPKGGRTAILSVSGGLELIQADKCLSEGLDSVSLNQSNRENISETIKILDQSKDSDMIVAAVPILSEDESLEVADAIQSAASVCSKPIACTWLTDSLHLEGVKKLRQKGIPVFESPRRFARAAASYLRSSVPAARRELLCSPSSEPLLGAYPDVMNGHDASQFVESYGLSMIDQRFCLNLQEVLKAGKEIGYPLVIKVVSRDLFSKNDARGIALNLRTEEELQNAYGRILERASRFSPESVIDGVLVQEMVSGGIECMIGMKRDPVFGPMVAVGLGGMLYELTKDLSLRLAPVDFPMALEMVENLKAYPLLAGMRESWALDFRSLASEVVKISDLSCFEPELELLDIGLVFVTAKGVKIADVYAKKRGVS